MNRAKMFRTAICLGIVMTCYQAAFAEPIEPTAPAYSWLFDEGTGTTTAASTGGDDGSLLYGAGWSTSTPFAYGGNHSIDLTQGTSETFSARVQVLGHTIGTAGTISMWGNINTAFTSSSLTYYPYLLDTDHASRTYYNYNLPNDYMAQSINGTFYRNYGWSSFPSANVWHHYVIAWDNLQSTKLRVYCDNVLKYSSTTAVNEATTPDHLFFGSYFGESTIGVWMGQIDEYGFWDSALSTDNVAWLSGHSLSEIIPEPSTLALLPICLMGLLAYAWRKRI
ncbi:MAG: hypothetical protein JW959_13940 [Pirellulales bacterium]|nr:hypothetical protein [Pirellulales bacterium]